MTFTTKKPPIISNHSRSYKRSIGLHISLLIIAVASIFTRAFIAVPEDASWVPDSMFKTFLMLVVAAFVSVMIEIIYSIQNGTSHEFKEYKRLIDPINSGLLIALLLPTSTPIYALILAVFIGVFIAKLAYGGFGYYIFNPALVGILFVQLTFADYLVYGDTPLVLLKGALQGASVDFNMLDLLVGNYEAVAIGSTSAVLLAGLFIYLIINKVIDWRTSVAFLGTVLVISLIVGYISFGAGTVQYTIVNMITGLTMFAAVFLVAESVSSPTSREAKLIYAVIVAIVTMVVRVLGDAFEGVVFAILLGNMLTPFLNRTVSRSNKQTLIKTSVILGVVVLFTGVVIGFMLQGRLIDIFEAATQWMGGVL